MREFALLCFCLIAPSTCIGADSIEEFFGTWVYVEQPHACKPAKDGGEGPWIFIERNFFYTNTGPCDEASMHISKGKLRLNASCSDDEIGYHDEIVEIELITPNKLLMYEQVYIRCTEKVPKDLMRVVE